MSENPQTLQSWSYSRLSTFEACKYRAKLLYLDRIPEPVRPLPPGKTEHANDRGTRIHYAAETYVNSNIELIPELENFAEEFQRLKALYKEGKVSLEGEWAFDIDWMPSAWRADNTWARIKLDAFVRLSETHAVVIDYKTGRKHGNEVKHAQQGQLYQLAAFLRYPELQVIDVELWYTDQNELSHMRFTRDQGLRFLKNFTDRGMNMTTETEFPPNPNIFSCQWCPFGPDGTGHCQRGVSRSR